MISMNFGMSNGFSAVKTRLIRSEPLDYYDGEE
jgi:hypothetical protein